MMKVNVYISYYNGSKYIDEQIDSLLNQKNIEVHVYIRDDGSKDAEAAYLNKYADHDRITIIHAENMGYGKSFMWLVHNIKDKADFYAFCDQDDVWLDYKLEAACKKIQQSDVPCIYSALPKYVDKTLNPLEGYHSFTDDLHFGEMSVDDAFGYQIFGLGCTYVWNNTLNDILQKMDFSSYSFPHDNFLSTLTPFVGVFYRDNLHPILYRQHGKNVGANKNKNRSLILKLQAKLKHFNNQTGFLIRAYIQKNFEEFIPNNKLNLLNMSVCYRKNIFVKLKFMKYVLQSKTNCNKKFKNLIMILGNKY